MIGNKIIKLSKSQQQNDSGTVTNEHDKETPKERCISPEERQEINIGKIIHRMIEKYLKKDIHL